MNAYLINTGSKLVMIDAGAGALFGPTVGGLANSLKAAGCSRSRSTNLHHPHASGSRWRAGGEWRHHFPERRGAGRQGGRRLLAE